MSVYLLAVAADIHSGSSVALMPPDGITLDDGQAVMPSKVQRWLWDQWKDCWKEWDELRDSVNPDATVLILNGDLVEGDHHGTPQQLSSLESIHHRTAYNNLMIPMSLGFDSIHFIRGTETHVGKLGTLEEGLARTFKAEGFPVVDDPDLPNMTSFHRQIDMDGYLIDARHHGRMGHRAHTRGPYLRYYAQDIETEYYLDGEEPPDLAIRSHYHIYGDSGRDWRWKTRVVSTPAWQAATSFVHRIAAVRLSDIGIVGIIVRDGHEEVIPMIRKADRPTPVKLRPKRRR